MYIMILTSVRSSIRFLTQFKGITMESKLDDPLYVETDTLTVKIEHVPARLEIIEIRVEIETALTVLRVSNNCAPYYNQRGLKICEPYSKIPVSLLNTPTF